MKRSFFISCCILFSMTMMIAQESTFDTSAYQPKSISENGNTLGYRILYPKAFDQSKKYPLVFFLHGIGERGSENSRQLIHGGRLFLDSLEKYPAVVVFPQCPVEDTWAKFQIPEDAAQNDFSPEPSTSMALLLKLLDELLAEPYIDLNRFYLSGLSMGGYGTWDMLWRIPEKIAVAMPICGGGLPYKAKHMTSVPIWAFHGSADDVVPPRRSVQMVEGVQKAGGKAKLTFFPEVGHDSWTPTFAHPEYLSWMFSKSLKK